MNINCKHKFTRICIDTFEHDLPTNALQCDKCGLLLIEGVFTHDRETIKSVAEMQRWYPNIPVYTVDASYPSLMNLDEECVSFMTMGSASTYKIRRMEDK